DIAQPRGHAGGNEEADADEEPVVEDPGQRGDGEERDEETDVREPHRSQPGPRRRPQTGHRCDTLGVDTCRDMDAAVWVGRAGLALVFAASGGAKLADQPGARATAAALGVPD